MLRQHNWLSLIILVCTLFSGTTASVDAGTDILLKTRTRVEVAPNTGRWHSVVRPVTWNSSETCIVVCDMWDNHWCQPSASRVNELAPRMNEVIRAARAQGVLIIHCPSDTMEYYAETPQRRLAQSAPPVKTKIPLERWVYSDETREGKSLPVDSSDGGCDCDPPVQSYRAWTRQHPAIEILEGDAVTDSAEAFYLMKQRNIANVIVMGVHTNMCVLGRPFSIRQMVRQGQNVVLMRDMTDTMYNPSMAPFISHFTGNDLVVEHIEQYWCPTITSSDFIGEPEFRFAADKRRHLVIVVSEPEYQTDQSLLQFARTELGRDFRVSFVFGDAEDGSILPGLEVLRSADVALMSIRRRTLKPEQMEIVREYLAGGKPLVAIRTSSHAFSLRNTPAPEGRVDWPDFDRDAIGGSYTNHHGAGPVTSVTLADGVSEDSPFLRGVDLDELEGKGSLYIVNPLQSGATPLLIGSIDGKPSEPVAWIYQRPGGGQTFYTSFGHVGDFTQESFRQLLRNACVAVELPGP